MMPSTRIALNLWTWPPLRNRIAATIPSICTMELPDGPDSAYLISRNAAWEGQLGWFPRC